MTYIYYIKVYNVFKFRADGNRYTYAFKNGFIRVEKTKIRS